MLPSALRLSPPFVHQPLLYMVFGVIIAAALFWIRSYSKIIYGTIEIFTGLFLMLLSMDATEGSFSSDFSSEFDLFHYTLKATTYLGGIFVIFRGCDNIKQGIENSKG